MATSTVLDLQFLSPPRIDHSRKYCGRLREEDLLLSREAETEGVSLSILLNHEVVEVCTSRRKTWLVGTLLCNSKNCAFRPMFPIIGRLEVEDIGIGSIQQELPFSTWRKDPSIFLFSVPLVAGEKNLFIGMRPRNFTL
ncbi:MAG: hypothetical protein KBS81_07820 [Spirochaetales bacterium]|nr:hypothetical protein [Candidatus Physcosoma equi]